MVHLYSPHIFYIDLYLYITDAAEFVLLSTVLLWDGRDTHEVSFLNWGDLSDTCDEYGEYYDMKILSFAFLFVRGMADLSMLRELLIDHRGVCLADVCVLVMHV